MKLVALGRALAAATCLAFCAEASAQQQVASVSKIEPSGTRQQGQDGPVALALDSRLYSNDVVETSPKGRIDAAFLDGTRLSLGPASRVTLDQYVYRPGARATAVLGVAKGALRFISGNVQRDGVRINTPTATIGIRGTEFVVKVGPDGATDVRIDRGIVRVWACDAPRTEANAYAAEAGYSIAVDTNCVVSVTVSAVTSPAGASPGPSGAAAAAAADNGPGAPGAPGGPAGGPGNGNGNGTNANGGGNTGGAGPGSGNGGANSGGGAGAGNGGGGTGNGGAAGGGGGGAGGGAGGGGGNGGGNGNGNGR